MNFLVSAVVVLVGANIIAFDVVAMKAYFKMQKLMRGEP